MRGFNIPQLVLLGLIALVATPAAAVPIATLDSIAAPFANSTAASLQPTAGTIANTNVVSPRDNDNPNALGIFNLPEPVIFCLMDAGRHRGSDDLRFTNHMKPEEFCEHPMVTTKWFSKKFNKCMQKKVPSHRKDVTERMELKREAAAWAIKVCGKDLDLDACYLGC